LVSEWTFAIDITDDGDMPFNVWQCSYGSHCFLKINVFFKGR
jgi:hypothetical protein